MLPARRANMVGAIACVTRMTCSRVIAYCACQSSSVVVTNRPWARKSPTLFTRISMRPFATRKALVRIVSTTVRSRMSPRTGTTRAPWSSASATVASSNPLSMSLTTTVAPSDAKRRLMAPPIPPPPPVTTATWSSSFRRGSLTGFAPPLVPRTAPALPRALQRTCVRRWADRASAPGRAHGSGAGS